MDAAAYRRLQHRMESRGRAASSHSTCDVCGYHCSCPPHVRREGHGDDDRLRGAIGDDRRPTRGAASSVAPNAQAWLLQRVQGVEVDITNGGIDHRRHVSCCCSCCIGYHHLFHARHGCSGSVCWRVEEREKGEKGDPLKESCARRSFSPKSSAGVSHSPIVAAHTHTKTVETDLGDAALAGNARDAQRGLTFRPSRSSLTLSSFIRLAESVPLHLSSVGENKSHEGGGCQPPQHSTPPHEYGGVSKESTEVRQPLRRGMPSLLPVALSAGQTAAQQSLQSIPHPVSVASPQKIPSPKRQGTEDISAETSKVTIDAAAATQHAHTTGIAPIVHMSGFSLASLPNVSVSFSMPQPSSSHVVKSPPSVCAPVVAHQVSFLESSASPQTSTPVPAATSVVQPTPSTLSEAAGAAMTSAGTAQTSTPVPAATSVVQPTPSTLSEAAGAAMTSAGTAQTSTPVPAAISVVQPTPNTLSEAAGAAMTSAGTAQTSAPVPAATSVVQPTPSTLSEAAGAAMTSAGTAQTSTPVPAATSVVQPTPNTLSEAAGAAMTSAGTAQTSTPVPAAISVVQPALAAGTPEPTPADVMNALREKLLLENADAYVRNLEQQRLEEKLAYEQEEQRASKTHGQILELLVRLRQDDQEMLEAMYENIVEPVEASFSSPASAVQRLPTPLQRRMEHTIVSQPNLSPFPAEVMTAYKMDTGKKAQSAPQPKPKAPAQAELPPPLPPPPLVYTVPPSPRVSTATAPAIPQLRHELPEAPPFASKGVPWGSTEGTMKAWVDKHFGSSLDPQHRALLQHVLLSREAEIRRVAAAESQCKRLEAQILGAKNSVPPLAVEETARANLSQWQQERDRELTQALSLIYAKEEELMAVRKAQEEQKAKLNELTRLLQTHSVQSEVLGAQEEKEELRRWKMRCDAIEQQHRFSVQRLEELQAYIEQLRNGAQQAVMNVVSSSAAARPLPSDTRGAQLSSVNASRPTCCLETASQHSTVPLAKPSSAPRYFSPPRMTDGAFAAAAPQRERPAADASNAPQPCLDAAPPPTAGLDRAAALKQLREEMDLECARFANETQLWHEYLKHQEERRLQLHGR
ncbi:hypothetical protein C3747_22g81 [Trypanosoma cruzi]|uniref:Uncharacterized protein n=2 Tax=Trypanosoma cruzi TaxID=5693 RepID=Q4DEV9_TRYCC|nr:hypothetical protein, conserved [Trypanosoma cruzi]EAN91063.1 hypothetical protein, conserved [Trypanosoma cruzi]PWV16662.1 hypothetical protein C3747_22g81 [Trypanosoma cruzi]|eukprot:XP_812914.1 hypothetical protein [Trypanosoma cruzi strain CL Brener]